MSKLKGVRPSEIEKRLKLFLYGPSGAGKTIAALQFPNSYIIDTEKGASNYSKTINEKNSVLYQSNDFDSIMEQLIALWKEEHPYKTVIIDPITILYQSVQDKWTKRFERDAIVRNKLDTADMQDFGMRYWGKVKGEYKTMQRILNKLDMNVIVTAHQKDVYGNNMQKLGVMFDSMKGDDYFFDNVFRLENIGGKRMAITEKQRADIGQEKFPPKFEWTYQNFLNFYGSVIEKEVKNKELPSREDIEKLKTMITELNIGNDVIDKWLDTADVEKIDDLNADQIKWCISFCNKKLENIGIVNNKKGE